MILTYKNYDNFCTDLQREIAIYRKLYKEAPSSVIVSYQLYNFIRNYIEEFFYKNNVDSSRVKGINTFYGLKVIKTRKLRPAEWEVI